MLKSRIDCGFFSEISGKRKVFYFLVFVRQTAKRFQGSVFTPVVDKEPRKIKFGDFVTSYRRFT